MAKPLPWWKNPQTVISCLVGLGAISSWTISQFVADAKQADRIEDVEESVKELDETVAEQEESIEETEKQYMLIQQTLGSMNQTLQEMKGKR